MNALVSAQLNSPKLAGTPLSLSSYPGDNRVQKFKLLASAYRECARNSGMEICDFRDENLPHFSLLSEEQQNQTLEKLSFAVSVYQCALAQGSSLKDSPAVIWQALRLFGLRPPSDLFSRIDSESIVEIHSPEGVQIFRNFNFYKLCSYSIEELYCIPWHALFNWGPEFGKLVGDLARRVYIGEITTTSATGLPAAIVTEALSPLRNRARLKMEWIAPLYREGSSQPGATIVIESGEVIAHPALNPVQAANLVGDLLGDDSARV